MLKYSCGLILLIYFALSSGCKDSQITIPPDVLSKEEMVSVLTDLRIAQASVTILEYTDTLQFKAEEYQTAILKRRGVTEIQFENSRKFYSDHPELLQQILEEVVNELSKAQGELEKK
ncbi:MAG: DUF4296 domain-containing protein [Bacteroidia bacterium]|nr:DUF4296 domain-containing protein [Bacteroidia bacterium]